MAEQTYPCTDCGKPRTKTQGGTTFTVCDECWDKAYKPRREAKSACSDLLERRDVVALVAAYDRYLELYRQEVESLVGIAAAHGWKSKLVEAGKTCRKKVSTLKAKLAL